MTRTPLELQREETLTYIEAMLGQLSILARKERCDMLTYLIEMAHMEVSDILRGQRPAQLSAQTGQRSTAVVEKQRDAPS